MHYKNKLTNWGAALAAAGGYMPIVAPGPPLPDVTLPPQPPLHPYNPMMSAPAGSLVEVIDVQNNDQPVCCLAGNIKAVAVCL